VVINKDGARASTAVLRINRSSGYASQASVSRLTARGSEPLSSVNGINLGGIHYRAGGEQVGKEFIEYVPVTKLNTTSLRIAVYMPPGSAALVRLPTA
jgi:hypothetical protein